MARVGRRIRIPVSEIEFVEGSNTLWVHSPTGGTTFRLKVTGSITSRRCATNIGPSHADATAPGDVVFCIGKDKP